MRCSNSSRSLVIATSSTARITVWKNMIMLKADIQPGCTGSAPKGNGATITSGMRAAKSSAKLANSAVTIQREGSRSVRPSRPECIGRERRERAQEERRENDGIGFRLEEPWPKARRKPNRGRRKKEQPERRAALESARALPAAAEARDHAGNGDAEA